MRSRLIWLCMLVACSTPDPAIAPPAAPLPVAPVRPAAPLPPPAPVGARLPDAAAPLGYDLRLEVDPEATTFLGHVTIRVRLARASDRVWLNLDELHVLSATYTMGTAAPAPLSEIGHGDEMRGFGFGRVLPAGEVVVDLAYSGNTDHDEQGLFHQREAGRWYLISQAESVFARRFAPCFDEPRFKAPWHVTLVVPAHDVALSNMPQVSEHVRADGRREVAFAETPAMASYLLAIAVGPFELVDVGPVGRAHVPVRVAALAGQRAAVGVVAARLPAIIEAAEALLGDALPLAKLDLVAVPHLFGAMENPGLITFDQHLLAGPAARPAFARLFVSVAAHEIVHQWFGDLVTPAWWDDLWLSEAFASYLGERIDERVGSLDDVPLARALDREQALAQDGPDARPLRAPIARGEEAEDDFDAISYDKGKEVLETIASWQGEDAFLAGVRSFLHAHRGGTATAHDLLASMPAGAARALASYLDTAGPPVVELGLVCDGHAELHAHARGTLAVPICVRYGDARGAREACVLVQGDTRVPLEGGCPAWVAGNARDGYYDVAWQTSGPLGPLPPAAELAPGEAIAAGDDVAAAIGRGDVPAADALAALDRLASAGQPYSSLGAAAIARALDPLVPEPARPAWHRYLAHRFAASLAAAAAHSDPPDRALREALLAIVPATAGAARQHASATARSWLASAVPRDAWPWIDAFEQPVTHDAVWHELRGHLTEVVSRLGADNALSLSGLRELCDTAARSEVAAAFADNLHGVSEGQRRLDHLLARIDRCIAARTRTGDLAAALAGR